MAVIQNSFTGDGSEDTYSFTFPYLKTADIKASIDAAATTAFTLPTATTLKFNTAPANGAKIKIYRETDADALTATFYAGSAIKSEDLNDNFTQNLYGVQEVTGRYMSNLGGTMLGDLTMDEDADIVFEGATADAHETTLTVADPTADRTITLPNVTGTVITTGDTGSIVTAMYADNSVTNAKVADGTIVTRHISDGTITTSKYGAGSINTAAIGDGEVATVKLANDAVTGAKIADDAIDSNHYAADSIDTEHYGPLSIDETAIGAGVVTTTKIADATITGAKIAADTITATQIGANAIGQSELADSSVDTAAIIAGAVATASIADDAVNSAKIADNAVVTSCINAQAVTTTRIANGAVGADQLGTDSVTTAKIAADAVTTAKIPDDAITTAKLADAELTTLAGMQTGTASKLAGGTALTADLADLNQIDGMTKETSVTDDDAKFPTSGAVVDYVAAQIAPIGGLEVIATDAAFPNTQPSAGVVISIADAGGLVVNGSGTSTTGRTVGSSTVTINNINSQFNSTTIADGVAMMVSSTGSGQVYNYHKATLKEADLLSLSNDINDFAARYRVANSAPSSSLDEGDLWWDMATDKLKVYDGSSWEEVASSGDFYINTISSYSGTGGNSATFNGSAYRFVLSNPGSAAQQHVVSVNGVIQKPNSGTSQPAEGFAIDGSSILFSSAPASGSDYFILTLGSTVSIGTPSDNTVATAKIQNLAVTTDKIAANAVTAAKIAADAIDGTKIADDAIGSEHIADDAVVQAAIADASVDEARLQISNSPTNGHYLQAQSGNTGGLTWAAVSQYTTPLTTRGDILFRDASGDQRLAKGTDGQFLKIGANDPVWADVASAVADGCIYENAQTISNNYTISTNKNALSAGPITISATLTIPSGSVYTIV